MKFLLLGTEIILWWIRAIKKIDLNDYFFQKKKIGIIRIMLGILFPMLPIHINYLYVSICDYVSKCK